MASNEIKYWEKTHKTTMINKLIAQGHFQNAIKGPSIQWGKSQPMDLVAGSHLASTQKSFAQAYMYIAVGFAKHAHILN